MLIKKAVLDRLVGKKAVVLVGEEEAEMELALDQLPEHSKEGDRLIISWDQDQCVSVAYDEQATAIAKERILSKMELLRQRSKGI